MTDDDELARRAEAGELTPKGNSLRGSAATDHGRQLLMDATGTDTLEAAVRIARGRPRLDAGTPADVTWRVRTTAVLDHDAREAAAAHGIALSQLVRDAVFIHVRALESNTVTTSPHVTDDASIG